MAILRPAAVCVSLLLGGCASIKYQSARFDGVELSNPTLGAGVAYSIPIGYRRIDVAQRWSRQATPADFEDYLSWLTLLNGQARPRDGFREALLFRSGTRYLLAIHVVNNLSSSFKAMRPETRALIDPLLAREAYQYFDVPYSDFKYEARRRADRPVVWYPPFRIGHKNAHAEGWRVTGYTLIGDGTDSIILFGFAPEADIATVAEDIETLLAGFRYGG